MLELELELSESSSEELLSLLELSESESTDESQLSPREESAAAAEGAGPCLKSHRALSGY